MNSWLGLKIESKPLRTVLGWQLYATAVVAVGAGLAFGVHGAVSAVLGGLVSWAAGLVFALLVSGGRVRAAAETLRILFRAEASKILLTVVLLWLVLTIYREVVPAMFFAAFIVSLLVSQAALLVRET
ncbi:MAG: ATP synthase subunit I [Burkholderiales bacterium]